MSAAEVCGVVFKFPSRACVGGLGGLFSGFAPSCLARAAAVFAGLCEWCRWLVGSSRVASHAPPASLADPASFSGSRSSSSSRALHAASAAWDGVCGPAACLCCSCHLPCVQVTPSRVYPCVFCWLAGMQAHSCGALAATLLCQFPVMSVCLALCLLRTVWAGAATQSQGACRPGGFGDHCKCGPPLPATVVQQLTPPCPSCWHCCGSQQPRWWFDLACGMRAQVSFVKPRPVCGFVDCRRCMQPCLLAACTHMHVSAYHPLDGIQC
jgi:hypothetical protein